MDHIRPLARVAPRRCRPAGRRCGRRRRRLRACLCPRLSDRRSVLGEHRGARAGAGGRRPRQRRIRPGVAGRCGAPLSAAPRFLALGGRLRPRGPVQGCGGPQRSILVPMDRRAGTPGSKGGSARAAGQGNHAPRPTRGPRRRRGGWFPGRRDRQSSTHRRASGLHHLIVIETPLSHAHSHAPPSSCPRPNRHLRRGAAHDQGL